MWKLEKNNGIPNVATIVNKSYKCDLYHLGEPFNFDGKWNFTIWLITSNYVIVEFSKFIFSTSFSRHVFEVYYKSWIDWHISYINNK